LPRLQDRYGPRLLRVAVIQHPRGLARRVVAQLRASLDRFGIPELFCEQGFYFSIAQPASTVDVWPSALRITWRPAQVHAATDPDNIHWPQRLIRLREHLRQTRNPVRVAVVDTGDLDGTDQIRCYSGFGDQQPGSDDDGHGTAVCALIRRCSPGAQQT